MSPNEICDHLLRKANGTARLMVAIAGPPGSGKSTLAEALADELRNRKESCAIVPMDGFHLDNTVLENRSLLAQKGAPQTFDAVGFVEMIRRLKAGDYDVVVPVFDRAQDKVIVDGTVIDGATQFILVEGNYLFLDEAPWSALQEFWDVRIFLNPGIDVIEKRLIQRWLDNGLSQNDAIKRAMNNDIPNARTVLEGIPADMVLD